MAPEGASDAVLPAVLSALSLSLSEAQCAQLSAYQVLLSTWNRVHNLTAIRDPLECLIKHIADSLSIAPYLSGRHFLDVGSGAGFPGIPLAIAFPEQLWTLLDANRKKTHFLTHAKAVLSLCNVKVVTERVEQFQLAEGLGFDGVVSRALMPLGELVEKTQHLYAPSGCLWAMHGARPSAESMRALARPCVVYPLQVPYLVAERHVVCVRMSDE